MTSPGWLRRWGPQLSVALLVIAGAVAVGAVTRGFRSVTSDGVRRLDLARAPRQLPPIRLVDSRGKTFLLSDLAGGAGRTTLLTLAYTNCVTICRTATFGQAYLQKELRARGMDGKVRLLTISFDPAHDTPAVLGAYAAKMGADAALWKFATVADARDLQRLLNVFEIVVLPDGLGGYAHNAALFEVDSDNRLMRAFDVERSDQALASLLPDQPSLPP